VIAVEFHPICNAFPEMPRDLWGELVQDMAKHGQRVAIVLWRGVIVDGRHRYRACKEIDLKPITVEFEGDEEAMILHVSALNSKRRDLDKTSRAKAANEIRKLLEEANRKKQIEAGRENGKKGGRPRNSADQNPSRNVAGRVSAAEGNAGGDFAEAKAVPEPLQDTPSAKPKPKKNRDAESAKKAAKRTGAGERYTQDCKKLEEEAPDLYGRLGPNFNVNQAMRELNRRKREAELKVKAEAARKLQEEEEEARRQSEAEAIDRGEEAPVDEPPARRKQPWTILRGDCVELLPTIPESMGERPRLVFADPPYNIGVRYGDHVNDSRPADVFRSWCGGWIRSISEILADDGSFWLLINDDHAAELKVLAEMVGLHLRQWIIWYESFGVNHSNGFNRCHRHLLWFVKDPKHFVFNRSAVMRPSDRQARYNDSRADPAGKSWDDVWGINPPIPRLVDNHRERIPDFPTQLPLALLWAVVGCASDPGDLVVDPFNGSGTAGVACIDLDRRYVGVELGEDHAEKAEMRLLAASHDKTTTAEETTNENVGNRVA
jgi:DNA modification methylase